MEVAIIEDDEPKVVFQNEGLLDIRCITTFGVTVKIHDNPIGQFGTGLKYAIAILLRNGIEPVLHIGLDSYRFTAKTESVRGKDFDLVYMNGKQMPFTTQLGAHWELWMAFRELYSNTQDECGSIWLAADRYVETDQNQTTFIVTGEEFAQILEDKADVFIQSDPLVELEGLNIHEGETNSVFNRGIKIAEFDKPLMNKYDITETISLTEDRTPTFSETIPNRIKKATLSNNDPSFIEKILTAPKEWFESTLNFSYELEEDFSEIFKETLFKLIKKGRDKLNPTIVRVYDDIREKRATRYVEESYQVKIKRPKEVTQQNMEEFLCEAIKQGIYQTGEEHFKDIDEGDIEVGVW